MIENNKATQFTFPHFRCFYSNAPAFGEQRIKFVIRCFFARHRIKKFCQWLDENPLWLEFFNTFPSETYPLIHEYLDRRLRTQVRMQTIFHDLNTAQQLFGEATIRHFINDKAVVLAQLEDDWSIWLNHNNICADEGWWALSLRNPAKEHIFSSSFGFINPQQLLITSIQGPVGADAKDLVRQLTKKMHGLRPQQLMVHLMQLLAHNLQREAVGISQRHQVKLRWKLKKRVSIDYDALWQENQGQLGEDAYWHLPSQPARKELSEISSQKRSMYRKRYALLDSISSALSGSLKSPLDHIIDIQTERKS